MSHVKDAGRIRQHFQDVILLACAVSGVSREKFGLSLPAGVPLFFYAMGIVTVVRLALGRIGGNVLNLSHVLS
jgi:hypothetical protein